ncbi:3'-5' exonuclease (plasmid) [Citricoccus nitrophenolicus]
MTDTTTPTINHPWEGLSGLTPTPDAEDWTHHLRAGFDTETTGKDPKDARLVTASLVLMDGPEGTVVAAYEWLINPGIEIPEEAANVHGVTTERAQADGMDPAEAVTQINTALSDLMGAGVPVVAFNAPYDFTVMDRESQRHGLEPITPTLVIDPYVMDKQADKWRKGKRTLTDMSALYGVELLAAHTSAADSEAAVRVADALVAKYPKWGRPPSALQRWLVKFKAEQSASFQDYLRTKKGEPDAVIDGSWPVIPRD